MSLRPWRGYSSWHGKGFVKRGYMHHRGSWRARPYYRRSFRKQNERDDDSDDNQPEIKDEVGADDDDVQTDSTQEDTTQEGEKNDSLNKEKDQDVNKSPDDSDDDSDVVEVAREEGNAADASKYEIDKLMLSEDWEIMDETDDEDAEAKKKKLAKDILSIEMGEIQIATKLKAEKNPLIGLEYLVEIRNDGDSTYYSCMLCKRPGRFPALVRHLNFMEHKMKYLEKHLGEVAIAFPRRHPNLFQHDYVVAMEKLCQLLADENPRPEKHLITTKAFYNRKIMAVLFRAEQLPHMTFKDDATWKKVFQDLGLPLRLARHSGDHRGGYIHERQNPSRSHNRFPYHKQRDYYHNSYRGRRYDKPEWVPYHQYRNYYYDNKQSWNYKNDGYYERDDNAGYRGYGGKSYGKQYYEKESRHSHRRHDDDNDEIESYHSSSREPKGIYATTIKKKSSTHEKTASKKEEPKATSAADVKKLWDRLTKAGEQKKKLEEEDGNSKGFWDQWHDVHEDEDSEVTIIDQVSSTPGASKTTNSDLNSMAEMLDKNLTQIMNNYDTKSGSCAYKETAVVGDKVALAKNIAKALTSIGMSKIPEKTLVLILQQLGLLPGGHAVEPHSSIAMDNLRKTIVKFESVSQYISRW